MLAGRSSKLAARHEFVADTQIDCETETKTKLRTMSIPIYYVAYRVTIAWVWIR